MMTPAFRSTAKIIQFPKRGRLGFAGHLADRQTANAATVPAFADFSSWYHEAAVREAAEEARKP